MRHKAFILIESLTALAISMLIITTLTYCINEQFKLLDNWEQRVTAHKVIWLNLKSDHIPNPLIVKDKKYYFKKYDNKYQVKVGSNVYQIEEETTGFHAL